METIRATVDGINKELVFNLQPDGWYSNSDYKLSINPTLNSCFTEPGESAYEFPIEVSGFKVLNLENLLTDVYSRMSTDSKPLPNDFAKVLSEDMLHLF